MVDGVGNAKMVWRLCMHLYICYTFLMLSLSLTLERYDKSYTSENNNNKKCVETITRISRQQSQRHYRNSSNCPAELCAWVNSGADQAVSIPFEFWASPEILEACKCTTCTKEKQSCRFIQLSTYRNYLHTF